VADRYREAGNLAGHDPAVLEVSIAGHGYVSSNGRAAKEDWYRYETSVLKSVGLKVPDRAYFDANYAPGGMTMVGEPDEIAERLIALQRNVGHRRHIIQMDLGGVPHQDVLRSIELLGTEVALKVRAELG